MRELAGEVTPLHVQWKWTLTTATRKHSLSREPIPGLDISTPGPISWESHYSIKHMYPNIHRSSTCNSQNRICKMSPDRLKGKDVLRIDNGPLLNYEKEPLKLWNYARGHEGGNRQLDSILGQAANIRLHIWSPSQWTLNFVPSVYRNGIPMENQNPWIKEPQDFYLDSPLPKRIC